MANGTDPILPPLASSPDPHILALLSRSDINSLESLAEAYQELFSSAFHAEESANAPALLEALNPRRHGDSRSSKAATKTDLTAETLRAQRNDKWQFVVWTSDFYLSFD